VVYRHKAASLPSGVSMLRFLGYLTGAEFIYNVESDVGMITLLEV
jgi:hypothetical protein